MSLWLHIMEISSFNLSLDCLIFASGRDTQQNNLSHLTQYLHTLRKTGTKVYAICVNLTNTYTLCVKVLVSISARVLFNQSF